MTDTETPHVTKAWAAVMSDIRELAKGERNTHFNFNFRGIDAVMNAVGPALRRHGVSVVPVQVTAEHRDVQTSKGKPARESTVLVTYRVHGPAGDHFDGMAPGESMDDGDKGTSKAMSVAMRTFLLQALCLPTQDTDPDAETYQRADAPPELTDRDRVDQVLLGLRDATTEAEARVWGNRAHAFGLLDHALTMPIQDCTTLGEAVARRIASLAPADELQAAG